MGDVPVTSKVETILRAAVTAGIQKVADHNRKKLPLPADDHPYLTGLHTPLTHELTLENLRVDGELPSSLRGRYLRNGPNPIGKADPASYHWFSGPGMVHGIAIENGKALWYRNRWVRGEEAARHHGEAIPSGPRRKGQDAPNTNIVGLAGRTFAIVEAGGQPAELDHELNTLSHNDFDGTLAGGFTAHPHHDPLTNEYHAITYRGDVMNQIWHVVLNDQAHVVREQAISVQHGPSIHDCAITENYLIIFDLPVTFSMKSLLKGYSFPYRWNPSHAARIGLLPRNGTDADVTWIPVDPCYAFHTANAFETADGKVIVDVVAHETMFASSARGPDSEISALERWTIDPVNCRAERQRLHTQPQEFPRYDERRTTRPYRYIYSVAVAPSSQPEMAVNDTRLYRFDLDQNMSTTRDFGAGRHPGEFAFIPRSDEGAEDDGWLMGLVIDANQGRTELQILNADDFTGPPQAVIHLPHAIPPGFHGSWVAQ